MPRKKHKTNELKERGAKFTKKKEEAEEVEITLSNGKSVVISKKDLSVLRAGNSEKIEELIKALRKKLREEKKK